MVYNKFGEELETESILVLLLYYSSNAIRFLFINGQSRWIPRSMILNIDDLDLSNFEDLQYIEIAKFIIDKNEIPIEY